MHMAEELEIPKERFVIKTYKRRWLVLTIYILCEAIGAFQWIEYSIITNIVMKYYDVDSLAVNWTTIIYLVVYTPLVIPASYIIHKQVNI